MEVYVETFESPGVPVVGNEFENREVGLLVQGFAMRTFYNVFRDRTCVVMAQRQQQPV